MSQTYLIRTLNRTQTKLIVCSGDRAEMEAKAEAMRERGAAVEVKDFESDAQARMSIDQACAYFRAA